MVAGAASAKVAAGAGQEISPAEVAAGAPSVEVAADAYPADNQDQEADGWLNTVQHLLTQRHRRSQSDSGRNKMIRLRRREWHKVGATKAACVDAAAACVDVAGLRAKMWPGSPSQKVAGPG